MGFRRCHHDDPFVEAVRKLYQANVLGAPRTGIDPLDVLIKDSDRNVELRGSLSHLIETGTEIDWPRPTHELVADLAGRRAVDVSADLALDLTAKFLAALGLPITGGSIDVGLWDHASKFDFQVHDVRMEEIDVLELGERMAKKTIQHNASTAILFTMDIDTYVIVRTLESNKFSIHGKRTDGQSAKLQVDAIKDVFGEGDLSAHWKMESESTLSFTGTRALTFAVAVVPIWVDSEGQLVLGDEQRLDYIAETSREPRTTAPAPLIDEDGLLEIS